MPPFRIYYDDGTVYGGQPVDAPGRGVVVVAQADPDVGRELLHQKDYYVWEYDRWLGVDTYGCWDYLDRPGWRKVLAGRTVPHELYRAIFALAASDDALPVKSARQLLEDPMR